MSSENITAIRAARLAFCDNPNYDRAQILLAIGGIAFQLASILPHLITLPSTWRLYRRYSTAFYILLYINILHCFCLVLFAVPSMEYLIGTRFIKAFPVQTFLLYLAASSTSRIYVLLAFNRAIAVLSIFAYKRIFSLTRINVYLALIVLTSIASCIFGFFNTETQPYSCMATMHTETAYAYAKKTGPIAALVMIHWTIWQAITGIVPMIFYALALARLLFLDPRCSSGSSSGPAAGISSSATHHHAPQQESQLRELWPLYVICLLGTLPNFSINLISSLHNVFKIGGEQVLMVNEFFAWLHNIQQPWLMLLLSRDMRAELRADMQRARQWVRRCCKRMKSSNNVQPMAPAGITVANYHC